MNNKLISIIIAFVVIIGGFFFITSREETEQSTEIVKEFDENDKSLALGGLTVMDSPEYVREIWGEPMLITGKEGAQMTYDYGNGLKIHFFSIKILEEDDSKKSNDVSDKRMIAKEIITTEDNGIKTPAGIGVGATEDEVLRIYGTPDEKVSYKKIDYMYTYYSHEPGDSTGRTISFSIKDGKVVSIMCYFLM